MSKICWSCKRDMGLSGVWKGNLECLVSNTNLRPNFMKKINIIDFKLIPCPCKDYISSRDYLPVELSTISLKIIVILISPVFLAG